MTSIIQEVLHDLNSVAKSLKEIAKELGVCFVSGTSIRTVRGDVAVETLSLEDVVITSSGAHRPIRWIGHRKVDCTRHADPAAVHPVRISANAFGPGKPDRDLFVSQGHAICLNVLDEVLVPASVLINGSTVAVAPMDEVTYWHVELDSHDILIANGQPAESFIDVGNRSFFIESDAVALDAVPDAATKTLSDYCRPFIDGGVQAKALRERIRHRALGLNWSIGGSPHADVHLVADGVRIEPDLSDLKVRFVVPAAADDVWLVSNVAVSEHVGLNEDTRKLGVCVGSLSIDDGLDIRRKVESSDPRLSEGFYDAEDKHRWTVGRAKLPASLWDGCRGTFFLSIDLALASAPIWIAPEAAKTEQAIATAA